MHTFIAAAANCEMPDERGAAVLAAMCAFQEAGAEDADGVRQIWVPGNDADPCFRVNPPAYPHDSIGNDHLSVGPFQQQTNAPGEPPWGWGGVYGDCRGTAARMDPYQSTVMFMSLPGSGLKEKGYDASNAQTASASIQAVQGSAYPDAYAQWWDMANALYDKVTAAPVTAAPTGDTTVTDSAPVAAPAFHYLDWTDRCTNWQSRAGMSVDLILLHTQEPGCAPDAPDTTTAQDLANFLINSSNSGNPVSYNRVLGQIDGVVTVIDVVKMTDASWSVLTENDRSIDMCFAGSMVAWTRQEWIDNMGDAIDVAAYLTVLDCRAWRIDPSRITFGAPGGAGYNLDPPCISDHRYCTMYLRDGNTHVDVGDNFPADLFSAAVAKYANTVGGGAVETPPPPPSPPVGSQTYTVEEGDTLDGVAAQFGVSLSDLEAANPQLTDPNLIYPGQVLTIP